MNIPDGMIPFARTVLGIAQATEVTLIPFSGRGSDRSYYRLHWNGTQSAVLVHYNPARHENACFADISQFLESIHIPVARMLGHEPTHCFLILQDLGDIDLWSLRQAPWEKRRALYQKTLTVIHSLHDYPAQRIPANQIQLAESFGPDLYRWERNYFMENFVSGLCSIYPESCFRSQLEAELAALAEKLSSFQPCLVHRDLQSHNVMLYAGEPFLIDFQGMRFGTLYYDLGSLLFDPYVTFSENERKELLLFYFQLSAEETDWAGFQEAFMQASAQRLMQALGAYGFLGITLELKDYLKHVRPGLENLCLAVQNTATLPCLRKLSSQCRNVLTGNGWNFDV